MRLFISYSHRDSAFVQQLTRDLQGRGFDVWIDQQDIQGGEAWRKTIVEGIDGCDAFIVVLSPRSVQSRNVVKEVSMADERSKRLFPVICEPCKIPADMEYQLAGVQYIDFSKTAYANALNSLVSALQGTPVSPEPQPEVVLPFQPTLPPFQPVGTWQVQVQHMLTGMVGYGQFTFLPTGDFTGGLNTPQGAMQAQGRWQLVGTQLGLQGMHVYTMMPYNPMPYALMIQITNIGQNGFSGVTTGGEQVVFQRVS